MASDLRAIAHRGMAQGLPPTLRHQAEVVLRTDSRAMSLATRLFGTSAPRMAEQYVSQVEMFFSALSWYLGQHPERAQSLLTEKK